jgi:pimeloyl-ACP methyl ester carboxylesterase
MTVPTLLLHGTSSPWPTRRICDLLERVLPDAHLRTVGGAGHMAPVTHRDQVNAMVVAQLDSNSRKVYGSRATAEALLRTNAESAVRASF